jgi:hypothetical protein
LYKTLFFDINLRNLSASFMPILVLFWFLRQQLQLIARQLDKPGEGPADKLPATSGNQIGYFVHSKLSTFSTVSQSKNL